MGEEPAGASRSEVVGGWGQRRSRRRWGAVPGSGTYLGVDLVGCADGCEE